MNDQGFGFRKGKRFFSIPKHPDRFWGPHRLLISVQQELFPWGHRSQDVRLTTHLHLVPNINTILHNSRSLYMPTSHQHFTKILCSLLTSPFVVRSYNLLILLDLINNISQRVHVQKHGNTQFHPVSCFSLLGQNILSTLSSDSLKFCRIAHYQISVQFVFL